VHEIGLVDDILRVINAKLKESNVDSKIKGINIAIGEFEHITVEDFEFHFRERTKGTSLENAKLNFREVEVIFKCKNCNYEFSNKRGIIGCPHCKSNMNDVISGTGIHVDSIEID